MPLAIAPTDNPAATVRTEGTSAQTSKHAARSRSAIRIAFLSRSFIGFLQKLLKQHDNRTDPREETEHHACYYPASRTAKTLDCEVRGEVAEQCTDGDIKPECAYKAGRSPRIIAVSFVFHGFDPYQSSYIVSEQSLLCQFV